LNFCKKILIAFSLLRFGARPFNNPHGGTGGIWGNFLWGPIGIILGKNGILMRTVVGTWWVYGAHDALQGFLRAGAHWGRGAAFDFVVLRYGMAKSGGERSEPRSSPVNEQLLLGAPEAVDGLVASGASWAKDGC
jgi:hypothetical protein